MVSQSMHNKTVQWTNGIFQNSFWCEFYLISLTHNFLLPRVQPWSSAELHPRRWWSSPTPPCSSPAPCAPSMPSIGGRKTTASRTTLAFSQETSASWARWWTPPWRKVSSAAWPQKMASRWRSSPFDWWTTADFCRPPLPPPSGFPCCSPWLPYGSINQQLTLKLTPHSLMAPSDWSHRVEVRFAQHWRTWLGFTGTFHLFYLGF